MSPIDHGRVVRAVEGQVGMARKRGKLWFIAKVRRYSHHILSDEFIKRVLTEPQRCEGIPGSSFTLRQGPNCTRLPCIASGVGIVSMLITRNH
ncbi:hypothetical protein DPMN_091930 [Dreissena polymorpha]|uniref:Uncharacterized protein n=1 Tax=Dreissena polymorpha TaxID=45954 RepID=A0A9D4R0F7_DREPO|nr:hypothetical protein DPMN_091930 [Dreissena polymorpha]